MAQRKIIGYGDKCGVVDLLVRQPAAPRPRRKWLEAAKTVASKNRCAFFAIKYAAEWHLHRTTDHLRSINAFPSEEAAAMWMHHRAGKL